MVSAPARGTPSPLGLWFLSGVLVQALKPWGAESRAPSQGLSRLRPWKPDRSPEPLGADPQSFGRRLRLTERRRFARSFATLVWR